MAIEINNNDLRVNSLTSVVSIYAENGNSTQWNAAYNVATAYQTASSSFVNSSNYLPLSGGTINGSLNVTNGLTVTGNISGNNLTTSFNQGSATGDYSFAEGNSTIASGYASHAEGKNTTASGYASHAEGDSTIASGNESHAEGSNAVASGSYSHSEGDSTKALGQSSHAEGLMNFAVSDYSHAEGNSTKTGEAVEFDTFFTDGVSYSVFTFASNLSSKFNNVIAGTKLIGYVDPSSTLDVFTVLDRSTITGSITADNTFSFITAGDLSSGNGYVIAKNGTASHAEGYNTTASGVYSHVEGENSIASGFASHAEGGSTIASGFVSHAEGADTTAGGNWSHAEGQSTSAFGENSHAEGYSTTASGDASHAEGVTTTASGIASHAEGNYTKAIGNNSHAAGSYVEARHDRTWAWKGSTSTSTISTTRADQFMVSAAGGVFIPGNVGIGTDSISEKLTVVGNISATSTVYASGGAVNSLYAGPMAQNLSLSTPISAINGVYVEPLSGYMGVQTFNPAAPFDVRGTMVYTASAIAGTTPSNIRVRDNYAYVTNYGNASLWVYDLTQTTLTSAASASTSTQPQGLYINGRYAYVVTSNSSSSVLQIFDISQATVPVLLSTTTIGAGQNAFEVVVQGNYAFVLTNVSTPGTNCYIIAYDISNPYTPTKVLSLQPTNNSIAHTLIVQGKYIYWGSSGLGTVRIYRIDTTDLRRTPTIETVYSTSGSFTGGIAVRGKYLYITVNSILYIIDTTTSSIVGNTGTLYTTSAVTYLNNIILQDNYAYISSVSVFVKVDISNLSSPRVIQSISPVVGASAFPNNFAIQGRYAYLPDRTTGRSRVVTVDLGGAYIQQLEAGGIKTDSLDVTRNTVLGNDLDVAGGAAFGQGFRSYKDSSVLGSLYVTSLTSMSASTYFSVASSSGSTLLTIASTGNVGINTLAPNERLTVVGNISSSNVVYASGGNSNLWIKTSMAFAVSDEQTNITSGNNKVTFTVPYNFTLTKVKAGMNQAPTGNNLVVQLSSITNNNVATTVTVPDGSVVADSSTLSYTLTENDRMCVDVTQVGSVTPGVGLKVYLIGSYLP